MNSIEMKMIDVLKDLRDNHGAKNVKAEFEAESTKLDAVLRLKEACIRADMGFVLKIGGCESIRDMMEARIIGVDYLVAPMVESPYALRKYLQAVKKVFEFDENIGIETFVNVETKDAVKNFDAMLEIPEVSLLKGIVIERVDLCYSLGLDSNDIDNEKINKIVLETITKAKSNNMMTVIGGGLNVHSIKFLESIPDGYLDFIETRKICFDCNKALKQSAEKGILKALGFELMWLRSNMQYHKDISVTETERMNYLDNRYGDEIGSLV